MYSCRIVPDSPVLVCGAVILGGNIIYNIYMFIP
jgi:hypothetical protein